MQGFNKKAGFSNLFPSQRNKSKAEVTVKLWQLWGNMIEGEREQANEDSGGAVVVKPTYTQFTRRFQLTLISGMDEGAHFLHLSKSGGWLFSRRSSAVLSERASGWSVTESFCSILFFYTASDDGKTCSGATSSVRRRLGFYATPLFTTTL